MDYISGILGCGGITRAKEKMARLVLILGDIQVSVSIDHGNAIVADFHLHWTATTTGMHYS